MEKEVSVYSWLSHRAITAFSIHFRLHGVAVEYRTKSESALQGAKGFLDLANPTSCACSLAHAAGVTVCVWWLVMFGNRVSTCAGSRRD